MGVQMTVFLLKSKTAFFSVPKAACTSIKEMLFQVENGFGFRPFRANGETKHIHNAAYPTIPFAQINHEALADFLRLAVVRDPVNRVISCYANRVVHYHELSDRHIPPHYLGLGAKPNPTLEEFVERLELYRRCSPSIHHHSEPLTTFLGTDASYFHRLFGMAQLEELTQLLSDRVGIELALPKLQIDGPKYEATDLSGPSLKRIKAGYAADYQHFGEYF